MEQPELHQVGGGCVAVYSNACPGSDSPNEDSAAIVPLGPARAVLIVADGLGGGRSGEVASRRAVERMVEVLQQADPAEPKLRAAIVNGIEAANEAVIELGVGAGSTLAVVEIDGETVRPYHVGDTKIVVLGGQGKLKLETVCHAPIARVHKAGLLSETAAMRHEDRNIVSNVLGEADMRIEIGPPLRLAPRDTVLLGSDGLFDNLRLREIARNLCTGPLSEAVERTVAAARRRMEGTSESEPSKPDDLTLVAFRPAPC